MILLLVVTLVLTGPAALAPLLARCDRRLDIGWHAAAKIGISVVFIVAAGAHFLAGRTMVGMLPPALPRRLEIVWVSGVLELLGAVGIWFPRFERLTGACLVALIILVFPANLYAALNHLPIAGHQDGWRYLLVRIPFQILLVVWVYRATRQAWFSREAKVLP